MSADEPAVLPAPGPGALNSSSWGIYSTPIPIAGLFPKNLGCCQLAYNAALTPVIEAVVLDDSYYGAGELVITYACHCLWEVSNILLSLPLSAFWEQSQNFTVFH